MESASKPIMPAYGMDGVFAVIVDERRHQDKKWGTIQDHPHEVGSWLTILDQLVEDAKRAYMSQRGDAGALDEIRQVVGVGVACMEQHGVVHRCPNRGATWNINRK